MEITKESLEQQIETWINEKHQAVAKLNMLEGAIQSYRVLLSQIENGAAQDEAAPDDGNVESEFGNANDAAMNLAKEIKTKQKSTKGKANALETNSKETSGVAKGN